MLYSMFSLLIYFLHNISGVHVPNPNFPIPPTHLLLFGIHVFILYVCVFMFALEIRSSIPFFLISHVCVRRQYLFFWLTLLGSRWFFFFLPFFFFISWRLITLQYCSAFCHTLKRISHGVTCVPYPDPPSHLPLHPLPLGLASAPGPSTCLMHPTWAGDLFHPR